MRPLALVLSSVLLGVVPATALASDPASSPFGQGGPLEPWNGPLPDGRPPQPAPSDPVPSSASYPPAFPDSVLVPSSPAPVDADRKPLGADDKPSTYVSAFVNPVLVTLGKFTTHLELAPYGPHALFVEVSRLSLAVKDAQQGVSYNAQIKGWETDFGYHFFPLSRGARGLYLGPRYVRGSGSAEGASGEFDGWGFDLGYQWVVADHLVLNLGAGAMRVSGSARLDPAVLASANNSKVDTSGLESMSSGSGSYFLPLVTVGAGLAI